MFRNKNKNNTSNKNDDNLLDLSGSGDEEIINHIISQDTICILDNVQDLIAFHEPNSGDYIKLSKSFYKVTQYDETELIGNNPYNFFHHDDIPHISKSHKAVLKGDPHSVTYRYRRKDGEYLWFDTTTQMAGKYLITTTRDVTERTIMEKENKQLADIVKGLIDNSSDLFAIHEIKWAEINKISGLPDIPLRYVSKSMTELNGLTIDSDPFETGHPDDIPIAVEYFKKILNGDKPIVKVVELRNMSLDGTYHILEMSFNIHGNYVVAVGRDITERTQLELIEKNLAVEKMERKKDLEAAQIFSHEAKNAFLTSGSISSMLEENLIYYSSKFGDKWSYIANLLEELRSRSTKGVEMCMNETLWRSLLHGTYTLSYDEIKLGQWMETISGNISDLYISAFLRDKFCVLDKALVETIINNAITNAIKYGSPTDKPRIIIRQSKNGKDLQIIVRNSPHTDHLLLLDKKRMGWDPDELFNKNRRLIEDSGLSGDDLNNNNNNNNNFSNSSGHGLWVTRLAANELNGTVKFSIDKEFFDFILTFPCEAHYELGEIKLPNMSVAILDDDVIERLTIENTFKDCSWITDLSIKGKTTDECYDFPNYIAYNQFDIAIFDECLFDDITGSQLMFEARKLGFKGIIVSRTSMDALSGMGILPKIADGFLHKTITTSKDITRKIHDIYSYVKKYICTEVEYDGISSITSATDFDNNEPIEHNIDIKKLPICEFNQHIQHFVRTNNYDAIRKYYKIGEDEIHKIIRKMVDITSDKPDLRCSDTSERPWRYVHQLKGIANNLGFTRVFDYTTHLCNFNKDLNRELLFINVDSIKNICIEAIAFVDDFLLTQAPI